MPLFDVRHSARPLGVPDELAVKAVAYQMPAWTVDGMDELAVEDGATGS